MAGYEYTYTITKNGYIGQTYTFSAQSGTIEIELTASPENLTIDPTIPAQWKNFRGNDENNGLTSAPTPTSGEEAMLYWAVKSGEGWSTGAPSSPIIVDNDLIFTTRTSIVRMDKETRTVLQTGTMVTSSSFNITPPTYADGMIFVALGNGTIQAFNADTLESLWVYSDPLKGQPNSPITYHDGYIYTGFWNGESKDGNLACVSVSDEDPQDTDEAKLATWTYTQAGGFYWAGAYVCDDFVLVGTDDGASGYTEQTSNLLSLDPLTGVVLDEINGLNADIRSSVSYDTATDRYYFASKGGSFYSVAMGEDGDILESSLKEIDLGGMSTSTPVVYNGRAYVGVAGGGQFSAYSGHNITVIDLATWSVAYTCETMGYPQTSGLLSTAYAADDGYVYVYFVDNYTPGQVRVVKDRPGLTEMVEYVEEEDKSGNLHDCAPLLFEPSGAQAQYAICSPIADEDGTLYFKNDSAHIMAVGSKVTELTVISQPEKLLYRSGETFDATGMRIQATFANGVVRDVTDVVTFSQDALTGNDVDMTITYPYQMYNVNGTAIPAQATVDIQVLSAAPEEIEADSFGFDSIRLSWEAAAGATGYFVYRAESSDGTFVKIANVQGTSYINRSLVNGKTYYYKVQPYASFGEGEISGVFSAVPSLAAPTGLQASVGRVSVSLKWSGDSEVEDYIIYRSESTSGGYAKVGQTDKTSFKDTGLETGKTYYYIVKGICHATVNGSMKTIYSKGISVAATPEFLAPTALEVTFAGRASVSLKWKGNSDVEDYIIYRSERTSGGYAKVGQTDKTSFKDTGLETGKTYYYIVKGICHGKVDGKIKTFYTSGVSASATTEFAAPTAPEVTFAGRASVSLKWKGAADVEDYIIYRSESTSGGYAKVGQTDKTSFKDTGLETGKTYYYIVKGICHGKVDGKIKTFYTSGVSASATTEFVAPSALEVISSDNGKVSLSWTGGPEVEDYIIYRSESTSGGYAKVGQTDQTTFEDTGLETGKTYYYIVKGICHGKVDGRIKTFYTSGVSVSATVE